MTRNPTDPAKTDDPERRSVMTRFQLSVRVAIVNVIYANEIREDNDAMTPNRSDSS